MKPWALASFSICWPNQPVPAAVVPAVVIEMYSPGLLRCRMRAAPISLWIAAVFSYSGSSRSKSIAFNWYLSTTFWYPAAVASGVPQVWPSLVPP